METTNSMTTEEIEETFESLVKAMVLKNVKLDFYTVDDKEMHEIIVSCPAFSSEGSCIYGIPYILSSHGKKFYITYERMRQYGLIKSEVIYHARQNTLKVINTLFACDSESKNPKTEDVGFVPFDNNETLINIATLNRALEGGEN